jgi:dUTP pyrophosphatase
MLKAVHFKRLLPNAKLPTRAYRSAGYDVYAAEYAVIEPGDTKKIRLGVAAEFKISYVALVWDRSGMGSRSVHRFGGVIDADYRGEWMVTLHNANPKPGLWRRLWCWLSGFAPPGTLNVWVGDKIAQILFQRVEEPEVQWVEELSPSGRGSKGFGSSDGDPSLAVPDAHNAR